MVATYDGATLKLYQDGVLSATTAAQTGDIVASDAEFNIGGHVASTTDIWVGDIALTAVYDRALNDSEIQQYAVDPLWLLRRKDDLAMMAAAAGGGAIH